LRHSGFIGPKHRPKGATRGGRGVTRKLLSKTDGPAPGYETLLMEATIEPAWSSAGIPSGN